MTYQACRLLEPVGILFPEPSSPEAKTQRRPSAPPFFKTIPPSSALAAQALPAPSSPLNSSASTQINPQLRRFLLKDDRRFPSLDPWVSSPRGRAQQRPPRRQASATPPPRQRQAPLHLHSGSTGRRQQQQGHPPLQPTRSGDQTRAAHIRTAPSGDAPAGFSAFSSSLAGVIRKWA
uniref:Uncharacterized protein n=1 Tax=Populus alba TaxID=43335 RepID=A0A4V6A9E0_POPAL|nr:hypothetical protein D5086_0000141050 [Populus alba]